MKNKNYLSDQIRNNIPKRNIEEGRESVRMFVEMLKKRKINVIDEAILNRAYEEEDYVDEKMLGLVLKALKIDEPVHSSIYKEYERFSCKWYKSRCCR